MANWGDKTWFITGASTGFGRAMADLVLSRGGRVIGTARDVSSLADFVTSSDGRAIALAMDVSDQRQTAAVMEQASAFGGGVDVLFNNAGYGFLGGLEESSLEEIAAQFDVNLFAPIRLSKAVLPAMRDRGAGYIVNMSSIAGIRSNPGSGFYSGSKFALEGISEGLALEVAPFGIKVMIVEPGYFRTDFAGRSIRKAANPLPAYEVLAKSRQRVDQTNGVQPGDPVRGVAAILAAMESETPPMRLPLGTDAYDIVGAALDARKAELEAWAETIKSTNFAG